MLSAFLVLAALVSGFLNGIGGSGGPVLLTALLFSGLSPVAAISTNKLTALIGSMGAIRNFSKERKVDLARSSPYLLATALGAVLRGSTLNPDFRPFSESAFSTGAGFKAMIAKVLWWHVCNSHLQT